MQVTITVFGPLGTQKKMEHKSTNFKSCVKQAAEDLMLISKYVSEQSQKEWEKMEVVVERN